MRGAGTADHTGDNNGKGATVIDPAVEREELRRTMTTCALTGQPLRWETEAIVVCPHGRLYHKEAAVQALLQRKQQQQQQQQEGGVDGLLLGTHVRGLKDLHDVRFAFASNSSDGDNDNDKDAVVIPTCPVRGTELTGQIPAVVLVPGSAAVPNVVSERALTEFKNDVLQEYGPAKKIIKLAPTAAQLKEIIEKQQTNANRIRKKTDKRKRPTQQESNTNTTSTTAESSSALGDAIRAKVAAKVQKSEALSSLFTSQKAK